MLLSYIKYQFVLIFISYFLFQLIGTLERQTWMYEVVDLTRYLEWYIFNVLLEIKLHLVNII